MKLYFLVEGISSEMQAYPEWLKYHLPTLVRFFKLDEFKAADKGYMLISGEGYPSILNHIKNSVEETRESLADYLFIILDSDEDTVAEREQQIKDIIDNLDIPQRLKVIIVVQNRCFETLLLGNKKAVPRRAQSEPLITYYRYFNAYESDPEDLGCYNKDEYTHSQFHLRYAKAAIKEKGFTYSKNNCSAISTPQYFGNICKRFKDDNEIRSLKPLIEELESISKLV
ncbi:hypothetical protein KW444_05460 [Vibrio fluvialis]|nr:hypothetical protein [Vibrio fluvialis]